MTFDSLLAAAAGAVGLATGAAYLPQVARIWRRRSSDDVSLVTYLLFLAGQTVYLVYGIRFKQPAIVVGMGANMVGNLAVIVSALRFRTAA